MKTILIFISIFLFFSNGFADKIILKNGKIFHGELIKVTPKYVIIETIRNLKLINISLEKEKIEKIIDESKKVLYESGLYKVKNLKPYYSETLLTQSHHRQDEVILTNGKIIYGKIVDVSDNQMKIMTDKNLSRVFLFEHISSINGKPFENYNFKSLSDEYIPINTYPKISFEFAPSMLFTNLSTLQKKMQDYLDREKPDENLIVDEIKDSYFGLQLSFIIKFTDYIAASVTGHFLFTSGEDFYHLVFTELRGYFASGSYRPWISAGWAHQSVKLEGDLKSQGARYEWYAQENAPSFAAGFETGYASSASFFASVRYLGFAKKNITTNFDNTASEKIDFSAFLLSLGLQINY